MKLVLCVLLTVILSCSSIFALKCYICSMEGTDADRRCLTNPAAVSIMTCNKKYCTTFRQDYKDPAGQLGSLARGCEDNPVFLNKNVSDSTYSTYYRACKTSLCNNGTGLEPFSESGGSDDIGPAQVLVVKGTGYLP